MACYGDRKLSAEVRGVAQGPQTPHSEQCFQVLHVGHMPAVCGTRARAQDSAAASLVGPWCQSEHRGHRQGSQMRGKKGDN